jgi:hypothetical protein
MITGYCVKCKEKGVELQDAKMTRTAKGGYMAKGKHSCGTTVCCIMSEANAKAAIQNGDAKEE